MNAKKPTRSQARFQTLFAQSPRDALVESIARDLFERDIRPRLAHIDARAFAARTFTTSYIYAAALAHVEPFNPRRHRRQVVGTALYLCLHSMSAGEVGAFACDVRRALIARVCAQATRANLA